jgi:hypothetical protein
MKLELKNLENEILATLERCYSRELTPQNGRKHIIKKMNEYFEYLNAEIDKYLEKP